jgi:hypothetical protein
LLARSLFPSLYNVNRVTKGKRRWGKGINNVN